MAAAAYAASKAERPATCLRTDISTDHQQLMVVLSNKQKMATNGDLRGKKYGRFTEKNGGVSSTAILSDTVIASGIMVSLVSMGGYISRPGWSFRSKHSNFGGLLGYLMVGSS